jgi:predicted GNAT family acetyltransferase
MHRLWRRAYKGYAAFAANPGEIFVFGEKAVAGVNRIDICDFGSAYYPRDIEIAFGRRRRANTYRLVSQIKIRGTFVRQRIHDHGFDTQLVTGPNYPQRYLTPIGYQDS